MQKLKRFTLLFLFLFTLPIAIGQLPFPNNELSQKQKETTTHVVHASTEVLSEPTVNLIHLLKYHQWIVVERLVK